MILQNKWSWHRSQYLSSLVARYCLFDCTWSRRSSRDTKHDRSILENIIETRLDIQEIEGTKVCCHPDGGNWFANSIHFGSRRWSERRKRRQKIDVRCGTTGCGVRRWTSVKNKLTQLRRVHQIKFVVSWVIQRKCRSGTRRRSLNHLGFICTGRCMNTRG